MCGDDYTYMTYKKLTTEQRSIKKWRDKRNTLITDIIGVARSVTRQEEQWVASFMVNSPTLLEKFKTDPIPTIFDILDNIPNKWKNHK